jgi:hypothetical protein
VRQALYVFIARCNHGHRKHCRPAGAHGQRRVGLSYRFQTMEGRMSTVLWVNLLSDGKVTSDEVDYLALYQHLDKLDALTRTLGLPSFEALCDHTDLRFNNDEFELPPGMSSTNEVMAIDGVWLPIGDAIAMLDALRSHIVDGKIRFGLLSNRHDEVVSELTDVLAFARNSQAPDAKLNFSVVM